MVVYLHDLPCVPKSEERPTVPDSIEFSFRSERIKCFEKNTVFCNICIPDPGASAMFCRG